MSGVPSTEDVSTLILRLRELLEMRKGHIAACQAAAYGSIEKEDHADAYSSANDQIADLIAKDDAAILSLLEEQQQRYQLACKIAEGLTAGSGEWVEKLPNGMEISVQTWTEMNPYVCAIFQPNGDDLEDTVGGLDEMVSAVLKYRRYCASPVIDNREGDL